MPNIGKHFQIQRFAEDIRAANDLIPPAERRAGGSWGSIFGAAFAAGFGFVGFLGLAFGVGSEGLNSVP